MKRDAALDPFLIVERILLGALTALLVAIPFVSGEDPGRLRLTSGAGPVSLNFCFMLLLLATCIWRTIVSREAISLRSLTPLLLAGVGAMAFWSSQQGERYAHPGLYVASNWIGLGAMFYLVRVLGRTHSDSRGFLNAMLAAAVSIACLGLYQSLAGPLELRNLETPIESSSKSLAGTDEFYPELNAPPVSTKPTRGTFDSPQTLLMYLFLFLPLSLVMAQAAMRVRRSRWLLAVPGIVIAGMVAVLAAKPFEGEIFNAWPLISEHSLFGVGPGNLSRTLGSSTNVAAWPELGATIGLIGCALFAVAFGVAVVYAWLGSPGTELEFAL